jgi:hypothetical protein
LLDKETEQYDGDDAKATDENSGPSNEDDNRTKYILRQTKHENRKKYGLGYINDAVVKKSNFAICYR